MAWENKYSGLIKDHYTQEVEKFTDINIRELSKKVGRAKTTIFNFLKSKEPSLWIIGKVGCSPKELKINRITKGSV